MTGNQDHYLFAKIKNDDLQSFEVFFRKYYEELLRFCSGIVRNTSTAEEITQEIFIYLWEKRKTIDINTSLKSYLYSAIKNRSINYLKYELPKQQSTVDISEVLLTTDQTESDPQQLSLLKKKVQWAIDQLPEKCKQIFILSRYGGLTYGEIAEELEISVKTVENQMSIALKKLRELLARDLNNFLNRK